MHEAYLAQLKGVALAVALAVLPAAACATSASGGGEAPRPDDAELVRIRAAVEAALTAPPARGYAPIPPGVRLLSIARGTASQIVMNFNRELLAGGTGRPLEDALHQILNAASDARTARRGDPGRETAGRVDAYRVLVDGTELEKYLP